MAHGSWANVSVGQTCVNDNTRYTAYQDNGNAYAFIVSRDKYVPSIEVSRVYANA